MEELCHVGGQAEEAGMVAESRELRDILKVILAISGADPTVLVTGESGTGKEVVVDQIHRTSARRDRPIVKVNCGAISPGLFESEFFGYEDGAFTGARRRGKAGFFELADGGTLLLDEIGEIPMDLQVKLLRAIQEGEITRVGGGETIQVDARLIAATNQDLRQLVREGRFRKDLFYRINVIHITIPPLRERRADILPLARHLLEECNQRYGKRKALSPELAEFLGGLDWPGNVRELRCLMEQLVLLGRSEFLTPEDLPEGYRIQKRGVGGVTVTGVLPLKDAVRQVEEQVLRNASQRFATTSEIAAALGVDRTTVSRKLGKYRTGCADRHS